MEKFDIPIPLHKPIDSRFKHLEIILISKKGAEFLNELTFKVMEKGDGGVMGGSSEH